MNTTKVTHLLNQKKELVGIRVVTKKEDFTIPVVDVRRNDAQRIKAKNIMKEANRERGSKFMKISTSLAGYRYN